MTQREFEHVKTIFFKDPDFMPIYLYPFCPGHVIALQTWCAFLIDVDNGSAKRIEYPAWAWNVGISLEPHRAVTIYFELKRRLIYYSLDVEAGKIIEGETFEDQITFPATHPPHLVTKDAVWFPRKGKGHSLVATRFDRVTDLSEDISKISPTDFFLSDHEGTIHLHRRDVGLFRPQPGDQPELVVDYRDIGCADPRGAAFDESGMLWILDEAGPVLYAVDTKAGRREMHDISSLHVQSDDLSDPSPYPWHSCVWCNGKLVVGCCDAARVDILRLVQEQD